MRGTVLSAGSLGKARHWLVAEDEHGADTRRANEAESDVDAVEARVAAAEKAGFEQGYADGLARAGAETEALAGQLRSVLSELASALDAVDERVEQELVELALAVARRLLGRELADDPAELLGFVRLAVSRLPVGSHDVRVRLHPDDVAPVQAALQIADPLAGTTGGDGEAAGGDGRSSDMDSGMVDGCVPATDARQASSRWQLLPEPTLARGSCLVESGASVVDVSVTTLVDELWAAMQEKQVDELSDDAR